MKKYLALAIFLIPTLSFASDIYDVTDYILFKYIPDLTIPFLAGILLIGLFTRFARNMNNI